MGRYPQIQKQADLIWSKRIMTWNGSWGHFARLPKGYNAAAVLWLSNFCFWKLQNSHPTAHRLEWLSHEVHCHCTFWITVKEIHLGEMQLVDILNCIEKMYGKIVWRRQHSREPSNYLILLKQQQQNLCIFILIFKGSPFWIHKDRTDLILSSCRAGIYPSIPSYVLNCCAFLFTIDF